jgi:hypothetical protein
MIRLSQENNNVNNSRHIHYILLLAAHCEHITSHTIQQHRDKYEAYGQWDYSTWHGIWTRSEVQAFSKNIYEKNTIVKNSNYRKLSHWILCFNVLHKQPNDQLEIIIIIINQFFILTCWLNSYTGANYRVSTIIKVQKYAVYPTNISEILLLLVLLQLLLLLIILI